MPTCSNFCGRSICSSIKMRFINFGGATENRLRLGQAPSDDTRRSGTCARGRGRPPVTLVVLLLLLVPMMSFGGLRHQQPRQRRPHMLFGGALAASEISQDGAAGRRQYSQVADFAGYDGDASLDQPESVLHTTARTVSEGAADDIMFVHVAMLQSSSSFIAAAKGPDHVSSSSHAILVHPEQSHGLVKGCMPGPPSSKPAGACAVQLSLYLTWGLCGRPCEQGGGIEDSAPEQQAGARGRPAQTPVQELRPASKVHRQLGGSCGPRIQA